MRDRDLARATHMAATPLDRFIDAHRDAIGRLYYRSRASEWKLGKHAFAAALLRSCVRRFGDIASELREEIESFLDSLHVKDLALASACLEGRDEAWRFLIGELRPDAERFARAIVRDAARAAELVDSLWADLYGLRERDGARDCPLLYYHGRSSLKSWLQVVIVRREADYWRDSHPTVPLDDATEAHEGRNGTPAPLLDPDRTGLVAALSIALGATLGALEPRDRLRLSYYYLQDLTLAECGALLGEHESTVSRNLARLRGQIRDSVERALKRIHRLSEDQIGRCFEYAVEDWPFDLGRVLMQAK